MLSVWQLITQFLLCLAGGVKLSHLPVTVRVGVLTAISHSAVHNLLLGKSVHRRIGRCQESWELASQIGSDEMIAVLSHLPVTGRVGGLIALPLVLYNLLLEKCAHRRIGRCQESWELAVTSRACLVQRTVESDWQ
ncbi:hypothetical protein J6590_035760 [Homalodisca vitripennis]|nr:hypothetical protein J6590_035760 [Homalodisca vitripennis]